MKKAFSLGAGVFLYAKTRKMFYSPKAPLRGLFGFGFAIYTSVYLFFARPRKLENMRKLLLGGGYAAGIFALKNIFELCGERYLFLVNELAVLDDINGNAGVNIAENIEVNIIVGVDLNDILFAELAGHYIFDDGDGAVQLVKLKEIVNLHTLSGLDMVDNYAVFDGIYVHAFTSRSLRMRAILMYFPLRTCLK